jgi:hypothetical protein
MSQNNTCPACLYTRKDTDIAPEWQCPNCQRAYSKTSAATQYNLPNSFSSSTQSSYRESNPAKWLSIAVVAVLASFFLWPVQPESRLYVFRSQLTNQFKSIGSTVGLTSSNEEAKQAIENKMAELKAYEDALLKVEADIVNARANVGTCSITGQPNQFILNQDPRPEIQTKIDQLKEEIRLLEKKS